MKLFIAEAAYAFCLLAMGAAVNATKGDWTGVVLCSFGVALSRLALTTVRAEEIAKKGQI